ncbi:MAG: phosphatase PAP2 family protein [Thermoleophilia bacterium]|nr:phosphatase PAP2 family protein [Thermoleophilia bacterium]
MNRHLKVVGEGGPGKDGEKGGLDARVFRAMRTRVHPRPLELAVIAFTVTGNYGLFWLGLSAAFWQLVEDSPPGIFVIMPLFLYLTLLANYIIKAALGRRRPAPAGEELKPLVGVPSSRSFPSSHAAMSFAAAIFMTFIHPGLWPLFLGLALAMSWSRVYVGVHYPSDVLAGTLVGLIMGGAILWLIT